MHVAGLTADVKVCLCLISRNCWLALTARCDEGFLLPDDVLLEIFDFLLREEQRIEGWITLAHVCRSTVEAGEVSFFNHHFASICNSFVHVQHV
jgi:hypothetical protein